MTKQDVLKAIGAYEVAYPNNDYPKARPNQKSWLEHDGYSRALSHGGKLYPPKKIISLITGDTTPEWHTDSAEAELKALGFDVIAKPGAVRERRTRR